MTIGEAQKNFNEVKRNPSPYFLLLDKAASEGIDEVFQNPSYFDALMLSMTMIKHATKSFYMLIGGGVENFIKQMEPEFRQMLSRIQMNKGEVKIAIVSLSPEADHFPLFKSCANEFGNIFSYGFLRPKSPKGEDIEHFTIADDKMYRLETPHPPIDDTSPADTIKADVSFNNKYVVSRLKEIFNDYWQFAQAPAPA